MSEARESTGNTLFGGGRYRLTMGLTALGTEEWLAPHPQLGESLAAKRDLLATRRDEVFRVLPEAESASRDLLALLATHLTGHFPAFYRRDGACLLNRTTGEAWDIAAPALHPLELAGRLVAEDLCLMQPGESGYRLVGASLCFPNRWRLEEKLGRPLDAIHAPVPGFAPALDRPVARFFSALKPDRILARVNWGIADDPALFQPIGREADGTIEPENAGRALWLRVERQTLRRLPEGGAVLFTIRTEVTRLDRVISSRDDAIDLAGAIRDMSPAMHRYKHLTAVAPVLLAWLDARSHALDSEQREGVS
jgi:Haem-dependent oxidative N-demethylase, alpha subunit-like